MNSIVPYTCPSNEYRIGAFGRIWTKGFAVKKESGDLLKNKDGSVMCFRTKSAAALAAGL